MKSYITKKRIFAILFLLLLFLFSAYNAYDNRHALYKNVMKQVDSRSFDADALDKTMSEHISFRMALVELYGGLQRAMDKHEYNNFAYVKDENGYLMYGAFYQEENYEFLKYAVYVKRMQDFAEEHGTKLLFVIAPAKYDKDYTVLRKGLPVNNTEHRMRELVLYLRRLGIETIDLNDYLPGDRMDYKEVFFKTDHHWTVPAAFEASRIIRETIKEKFGKDIDPDNRHLCDKAYTRKKYYGGMLGSMGRDTGILYSGLEDFTALFPTEEGRFRRYNVTDSGEEEIRKGGFTDAFLDMEVLSDKNDYYQDSQYGLYLDQIRTIENIENLNNKKGPSMFMIRDSYFAPVIAFLAPCTSRIDAVWSLYEMEDFDITSYLKNRYKEGINYDYIIVETYPYNIEYKAFRFFRGKDSSED